jgi:D-beta-D-heptose 7-phosphate kinase/D-beta-D-heptose 1-phosphate adenosyltransferase
VILSDYAKGVLVADVAARLIEHAKSHGKFIAVDPKLNDFTAYRSASVITPNVKEAERASGIKVGDYEALLRAGQRILDETGAENLLITRGDQGMTLFEGKEYLNIPTFAREVFDVTGAGDTVIATLALAIGAGATVREASFLANCAAGIVVGKFGTASVSTRELYTSIDGTPQIDSQ